MSDLWSTIARRLKEAQTIIVAVLFFSGLILSVDAFYVRAMDYNQDQAKQALRWNKIDIRDLYEERAKITDLVNKAKNEHRPIDPYFTKRLQEIDDELSMQKSIQKILREQVNDIEQK